MIYYDEYRRKVLYLLYDWVIQQQEEKSPEEESQFLQNPVVNHHIITEEELHNSFKISKQYCEERTHKSITLIPLLAVAHYGAGILWLRCNKYVDTRDETGNYIVSYGDYLMKECEKTLKFYLHNKVTGFNRERKQNTWPFLEKDDETPLGDLTVITRDEKNFIVKEVRLHIINHINNIGGATDEYGELTLKNRELGVYTIIANKEGYEETVETLILKEGNNEIILTMWEVNTE